MSQAKGYMSVQIENTWYDLRNPNHVSEVANLLDQGSGIQEYKETLYETGRTKYPQAAGKQYIHKRSGQVINIAYRHNLHYYTFWRELSPLVKGFPSTRVYGKVALHHLFNNYVEVIPPCATKDGGTPASV